MKLLSLVLTKTGILRWLGVLIAGALVSWGVIAEGSKTEVAGTATLILLGIGGLLIEGKKDGDTAILQEAKGAKPDGWAGPKTFEKITGRPKPKRLLGNPKFGILLLLAIPALGLAGCEVMHRPGIVVRDKVAYATEHGTSEKMEDIITINGDAPGLAEVPTPRGPIKFNAVAAQGTRLVYSGTTLIGTESYPIVGGLFTTEHVKARGEADKSRIKETSAGVSGAIVSGAGAALVGPGVGAIPK